METKSLKVISWLFSIIIAGLLVFGFLAKPYRIHGDCMEPAIKKGKLYFLNKLSPYIRKYQIDDIIIFKYEEKPWIARIVALENDTIQIDEGTIRVNGSALDDKVLRNWNDWKFGTYAINESIKVPSGHVYALSDNLSAHHDDSRVFGPIPYSSIFGVLW